MRLTINAFPEQSVGDSTEDINAYKNADAVYAYGIIIDRIRLDIY